MAEQITLRLVCDMQCDTPPLTVTRPTLIACWNIALGYGWRKHNITRGISCPVCGGNLKAEASKKKRRGG